ncbi:cyclase-associated protein 1-like [Salvia divinorum]|uniref:Cyclase-associated protein 1-like n=1 Tax=Salvia divinorum TaxID=28513 RepID=A0ABD1I8K3_SALDI
MEESLLKRLEASVARLEALSVEGLRQEDVGDAAATDQSIVAFDDIISQYVGRVTTAAEKIGGHFLDVSKAIAEAFRVERELLVKIKQTQKPDMAGLIEFLKPLNEVISKASALTEGRRSDFFHHLKTGADSLAALAWIAYTGKDCGMSIRCQQSAAPAKAAPTYGTPAPPPPPPASLFSSETAQPSSSAPKEGMSAVFAELNSGKQVTSGLKKVTADMKTKNRADRGGIVTAPEKGARAGSSSFSKSGPPKLELQIGRKWVVENQIGRNNLVIDDCDAKQSVYVFGCKNSVLQVQGKVNNITIDNCTTMGVVFKDVVAACEIVNCSGVEVQCLGSAPTISVDNTAGCQLYLSKEALGSSITTEKSSEINVLVPGSEPDGDWGEHALPQQYIHVYKDGQFVTTPVSHSGG